MTFVNVQVGRPPFPHGLFTLRKAASGKTDRPSFLKTRSIAVRSDGQPAVQEPDVRCFPGALAGKRKFHSGVDCSSPLIQFTVPRLALANEGHLIVRLLRSSMKSWNQEQ